MQSDQHRRALMGIAAGSALVLAGMAAALWLSRASAPAAEIEIVPAAVSYPAPTVLLTDLQGRSVSLRDYSGLVVLVNLWATWCAPCEREMPALDRFHSRHAQEGFAVIAINSGEEPAQVAAFAQELRLSFPIWLDPGSLETARSFHTAALPTSFVIDRSGTVRLTWTGGIDLSGLEEYVTPIIRE